jgi:hypothetical protein
MENKINIFIKKQKKTKNKMKIYDSCTGRRGCYANILANDGRINPIYSKVLRTRNDIQKMVLVTYILLDKMVEKKR